LLLDEKYNLKRIDFGLSNIYNESELLKTACGSPCYAAPEMIAGQRYKGLMVDIWSSGVILYAMVCGFLPFEDQNTTKLYNKILVGEFEMPEFLSENAQDLIKKILTTDPNKRMTIEQIRSHPWCKKHFVQIDKGIHVGYDEMQIDQRIIDEMKTKYGERNSDYVAKCILANKSNYQTTTYYLLKKLFKKPEPIKAVSQSANKADNLLLFDGKKNVRSSMANPNNKNRNLNILNVSKENIPSYKIQLNFERNPLSLSIYRTLRDNNRERSQPPQNNRRSNDKSLISFDSAKECDGKFTNVFELFKDTTEFEYKPLKIKESDSYCIGNMSEVNYNQPMFLSKRGSSQGPSNRSVRSQACHYRPVTKYVVDNSKNSSQFRKRKYKTREQL